MAIQNGQDCQNFRKKSPQSRHEYRILSPHTQIFHVTTKFHLQDTQYLRPTLKEEMQVADDHHDS